MHGMKTKKPTRSVKYPHFIRLPKGCKSPTGSIYQRYDIVQQGRVLNSFADSFATVRSAEPFTLRVLMPNGKLKDITSTQEKAKV